MNTSTPRLPSRSAARLAPKAALRLARRAARALPDLALRTAALFFASFALFGFNPQSLAATYEKTSTVGALNTASTTIWTPLVGGVSGNAPGSADIALFDSNSGGQTDTLGGNLTIGQIAITNPGAAILIQGDSTASTLTLNGVANSLGTNVGIDMSLATKNLSFGGSTDALAIGAAQSWLVAAGDTLALSGTVSGSGNVTISGGGAVTLQTYADTYTGNFIVNGATALNVNIGQSTDGFLLGNGATLSTTQNLSNSITANFGSSTFTEANFGGAFLGNGTITTGGSYSGSYANSAIFQNFGGTVIFSANNYYKANSFNNAPFATLNMGTGTGSIQNRNAATTIVLGGVAGSGASTSLNANNSGTGNTTYIIGSANGTTTFAGGINGPSGQTSSFVKVGTGTLTLTGASTGSAGVSANGGTLGLNYSVNTSNVLASSNALTFGGGSLLLTGNSAGTSSQTFASTTLGGLGGAALIVNPNGGTSTTLALGGITATAAGGSLNIQPVDTNSGSAISYGSGSAFITTTTNKGTDGTYGARLTYGSNWATTASSGSPYTLSAYSGYTTFVGTGGVSTTDYSLNDNGTVSASESLNSLKITDDTTSQALALGTQTLTLTNGGLLFAGPNNYSITGGTLKSATATNSELIVQQLGAGSLTIGSVIANGTGTSTLTKAGYGTLILGGVNTYTGITSINGGILSISADSGLGAIATGAALDLNGGTLQATSSFTLDNSGASKRAVNLYGGGGTFDVTSSNNLTVDGVITNGATNQYGPLIKTDSGTLTLSGANTYTGATIISGGILSTASLANGGTASGIGNSINVAPALVLDGGTLQYTGVTVSTDRTFTLTQNGGSFDASGSGVLTFSNTLAGAYTGSGNRTLTLTGNNTGANTLAGQIIDASSSSGSGLTSISKTSSGQWVLSNVNNLYSGNTTVSGGTLALSAANNNNIPNSPVISVASGATLNVSGLNSGTLALNSSQTLTGAGTVTGTLQANSGSIITPGGSGVGILTIGTLSISAGSIFNFGVSNSNLDGSLVGASDNLISATNLNLNGLATLNLYVPGTTTRFSIPNPGTGNSDTYDLFKYTGTLTGTPSSSLFTIGSATANPAYTYTFGTSTSGGNYVTLTVTQTGVSAAWQTNGNGNWSYSANWNGGVPHNAGDTASFGSVITSPATVTLDANETVAQVSFNNANSYTISGANTLTLDSGGLGASLIVSSGSHSINVPISLNDNLSTTIATGSTLTVGGVIANASSTETLTVNGPGTTALTQANTYGPSSAGTVGTTLASGILNIGNNTSLGAGDLAVSGNGTLQAGAAGLVLANNISITGGATATLDDNGNTFQINGLISQSSASGLLTKVGSGTVILTSNETYGGITTISNGTLQLGNAGTTGSVAGGIVDNATLASSRSDNYSLGNAISGTGNFNQIGAGNLTLTAANSFSGTTTVGNGTLTLGNANALQNSTLNYNNQGGTFSFGTQTAPVIGALSGAQNLGLATTGGTVVGLTVGGNGASTTYSGALSGASGSGLTFNGVGTFTLSGNSSSFLGSLTASGGFTTFTGQIGASGAAANTISVNTATFNLNGGSIYAATFYGNDAGTSLFNMNGGTLNLSGVLGVNSSNGASQGLVALNSGTVSVGSVTIGRASDAITTPQTAGSSTVGLYVNGATVTVSTTVGIGTSTSTASSAEMRVDSGSVTVGGITDIADNNGRYSILDLNGGTFNGPAIQIGNSADGTDDAELLVRGSAVLTTGTIQLGGNASQVAGNNDFYAIGGTSYIGAGGIVSSTVGGTTTNTVNLGLATSAQAPVIAATAPWSSSAGMTLVNSTSAGAVVFKTADSSGNAQNITLSGILTGTGGLTKTGAGTLLLTGANSYTGVTTITAGTLEINGQYALGGGVYGGLTFNGGTLEYTSAFSGNGNGDITENSATTPVAQTVTLSSGGGTINLNGNTVSFAKAFGNSGTGALTVTGGGSLTMNGAVTYSGATNITGGSSLIYAATSSLPSSSAYNIAAASTLDVSALGAGLTVGTGKAINATAAAGSSSTVNGLVTLSGGTIGTGAKVEGATAVGQGTTLNIGSFTLNSGNVNFTLPSDDGLGNSLVDVTNPNGLTINGGTIGLTGGTFNAGTVYNYTVDLFQYTGTLGGNASNLSVAPLSLVDGLTYTFGTSGGYVTLNIAGTATLVSKWNVDGGGSWSTAGNWTPSGVPSSSGAIVRLAGDPSTDVNLARTVTLDGAQTVGTLYLEGPDGESYTISQGSTIGGAGLTIDNVANSAPAQILVTGTQTVDSSVNVALTSNTQVIPTNAADKLTIAGVISNTSAPATISKTGNGTLILSGANTYGPSAGSIGTTLTAGTIQAGNNTALGAGDLLINGNATLQAGVSGLNLANNIQVGSGNTATFDPAGHNLTLSGVISDATSGGVVAINGSVGTGSVAPTGANTYSGGTILSSGILLINNSGTATTGPIGTGALTITGGTIDSASSGVVLASNNALNFNGNFTFAGTNSLDLGSGAVTLGANSTVTVTANSLTLDGSITGAGKTLGKAGAGTLILTGATGFTGTTSITAGAVQLNNANALASSTVALGVANGLKFLQGAGSGASSNIFAVGALSGASGLQLDDNGSTAAPIILSVGGAGATTTYSGILSDAAASGGGLTVTGGDQILTGVSTYRGPTVVNGGKLELDGPNLNATTIDSSSGLTINSGGTVQNDFDNAVAGPSSTIGTFPITVNAGGTLTNLGSADSNAGATAHLRGVLTLNGGTLADNTNGAGNALVYGDWDLDDGVTVGTGNTTTSIISATDVDPSETGGTVFNVGAGTTSSGIDLNVTGTLIKGTSLADTGIKKQGAGVMQLGGLNTFTGAVTVTAGTLIAALGNSSGSGPVGSSLGETDTAGRTVTVTGATLDFTASNILGAGSAFTAANYAAVSLTTSTLNLTGASSNNTIGNLTLNGSTVALANGLGSSALYEAVGLAGTVTVTGAASFITGGTGSFNGINLGMGTSAAAGGQTTFTVGSTTGGTASGGTNPDLTISAPLVNGDNNTGTPVSTGISKAGTGTLLLTAANTFTGPVTISAGTLQLGDGTSGHDGTITSSSGITDNAALVYDRSAAQSSAVAIGGTGTVSVTGGQQTLTGVNTYSGATSISSGATLQLGDGTSGHDGTIASTSGITDNGTLVYNRFAAQTTDRQITGTGSVTVSGGGSQTLSNTGNSYSGGTTVSAGGTLIVTGGLTGNGAVTVNGTLGGTGNGTTTGIIDGAVTESTGGNIAPGVGLSTAGSTLTLGSNLTLGASAGLTFNLDGGGASDLLAIGGSLTLDSGNTDTLTLNLLNFGSVTTPETFTIATYNGSVGGATFGAGNANVIVNGGTLQSVNYDVTDGSLSAITVTVVPEPGTWASLIGGLGILVVWQRSRRRRTS
jgi:autotransporter-associated beta strand protein